MLRLLASNYKTVFEMLVRMVVDIHNDCLVETVSARSWLMQSLACQVSDHIFVSKRGHADVEFAPFKPLSSELHQLDPNYYKQMLDISTRESVTL